MRKRVRECEKRLWLSERRKKTGKQTVIRVPKSTLVVFHNGCRSFLLFFFFYNSLFFLHYSSLCFKDNLQTINPRLSLRMYQFFSSGLRNVCQTQCKKKNSICEKWAKVFDGFQDMHLFRVVLIYYFSLV